MTIEELVKARDQISKIKDDYIEEVKREGSSASGLFLVEDTAVLCEIAIDLKRLLEKLDSQPKPLFVERAERMF